MQGEYAHHCTECIARRLAVRAVVEGVQENMGGEGGGYDNERGGVLPTYIQQRLADAKGIPGRHTRSGQQGLDVLNGDHVGTE